MYWCFSASGYLLPLHVQLFTLVRRKRDYKEDFRYFISVSTQQRWLLTNLPAPLDGSNFISLQDHPVREETMTPDYTRWQQMMFNESSHWSHTYICMVLMMVPNKPTMPRNSTLLRFFTVYSWHTLDTAYSEALSSTKPSPNKMFEAAERRNEFLLWFNNGEMTLRGLYLSSSLSKPGAYISHNATWAEQNLMCTVPL